MTGPARIAACAALATIALATVLAIAQSERGLGLLVYVLVLCALGLFALLDRLRGALPAAPSFPRRRVRTPAGAVRPEQLEAIDRRIALAGASDLDLHFGMRPLVREILAARLVRRHGVDLDGQPERAHELVGDGLLWELARPGRRRPDRATSGGLTPEQLGLLIDELEAV